MTACPGLFARGSIQTTVAIVPNRIRTRAKSGMTLAGGGARDISSRACACYRCSERTSSATFDALCLNHGLCARLASQVFSKDWRQVVAALLSLTRQISRRDGTPTVLLNGWRYGAPPDSIELERALSEIRQGRAPFAKSSDR